MLSLPVALHASLMWPPLLGPALPPCSFLLPYIFQLVKSSAGLDVCSRPQQPSLPVEGSRPYQQASRRTTVSCITFYAFFLGGGPSLLVYCCCIFFNKCERSKICWELLINTSGHLLFNSALASLPPYLHSKLQKNKMCTNSEKCGFLCESMCVHALVCV